MYYNRYTYVGRQETNMLCSICHKNMAVIFTKKIDGEKSSMEGLCYNCAKEKGINPLEVLAKQANLSEEELNDMSKQFENLFDDLSENLNIEDLSEEELQSGGGIPLGSIFSNMFGNNSPEANNKEDKANKKVKTERRPKEKKKSFLDIYGTNLTNKARKNELDIVIGRDKEIERVIQILNRRSKNNPCLIGEPGVGKTAIATLKNIPIAIKEVRPMLMLSVPALARNFRKSIETNIKAKGKVVERLYEFALNNAIKYNKEYWNRGGWQAWRYPLVKLFDKIIFKAVRQGFGGRMRFFVGGGALLDIELQRYFCAVGMPMFQGYGLSEATPIICANSMGHAIFGSSGRIVSPLDLKICDDEGNELPHGQKGEIVIKGENVMAGYWKNPESTAKTVVDGWLHTGDMGYVTDKHPGYLWVVGRFKSLLISADGEKYSPEGFEDSLTDSSKYIEQVILHNNQDPYTIVLIVPNKEALKEYVKGQGINPTTDAGKKAMLQKIQDEVNEYRNGKFAGMFPEQWLPKAIAVLPEAFTEQNHMVNSTMKIVRGKVEEYYADRIEYAYTLEGKELFNEKNISSF